MKGIKDRNPMQTRHGRPRYKAFNISQLTEMLGKASTPKTRDKIRNALNYKINAL